MIKEMIEQGQGLSTQLPSGVILYEADSIVRFLETGIAILPSTARSSWSLSTDEQYEYVLRMHKRLSDFYDLYQRSNLEMLESK